MENGNSKISAIVITYNEAQRIEECLGSLAFVSEIVVVDNGSTDQTVSLAKKQQARVFLEKTKNFSKLRNLGWQKAKNDWLLYVDADERITPKLATEIQNTVRSFSAETSPHGYFIKRRNFYLGHEWPYQDKLERLFWKKSLIGWYGKLHETARIKGSVGIVSEPLLHYTHRTLEEMVEKTNQWSTTEAELRLAVNHPPVAGWRFLRVMATGFWDSFVKQGGWRAGTVGWIESIYQGFSLFITYAKLWELQQIKQK